MSDQRGAKVLLWKTKRLGAAARLVRVWADGGYTGTGFMQWVINRFRVVWEVVHRSAQQAGFQIVPKRWIVERTFGWFFWNRRLSKDYEVLPTTAEAFVYVAMIRLMIKRLAAVSRSFQTGSEQWSLRLSIPTIELKRRRARMLASKWAYQPLSGAGAARHGGRFNEVGKEALYIFEDYVTAISEYEQELGIRPGTLCAYDVDLKQIVDLTDPQVQTLCSVSPDTLKCPWKEIWLILKQRPPTWDLAQWLIAEDYAGIRVPSVLHLDGIDIVLWRWNDSPDRRIRALDPQNDLPNDQSSWNASGEI